MFRIIKNIKNDLILFIIITSLAFSFPIAEAKNSKDVSNTEVKKKNYIS